MKTADEIKKGLECCSKSFSSFACMKICPYIKEPSCGVILYRDAITYIQKLEAEVNEALAYIQKLEPERDAAVDDMTKIVQKCGESYCEYCKNWRGNTCPPYCRTHSEGFRWRGVQKTEKRHAQVGDYVKIVKVTSPVKRFRVGGIYMVVQLETEWNIPGAVILDCGGYYASPQEYVVLDTKEE